MAQSQPNARCYQSGHKLAEVTARKITLAVDVISERLAHLDGIPARGERNGGRSSAASSTTEQAAIKRYNLTEYREQLRDAITDACNTNDCLDRLADEVLRFAGHVTPDNEQPTCIDGQHGKEGVIEWGDPLCRMSAVKAGMCSKHYMRWYRHRTDHGIDTSKDFEAA
jgi:hypothetical protein